MFIASDYYLCVKNILTYYNGLVHKYIEQIFVCKATPTQINIIHTYINCQ